MKSFITGVLLLVAAATLCSAANAQSTRKMDMAETMGQLFSSLNGINHNPNNLLWTLSTFRAGVSNAISTLIPTAPVATSRTVFLEKGSDSAGLKHIWIRHGTQFAQLCKVNSADQLQQYLYSVMSQGWKSIWAYKTINGGGLKIVYKLPGLFLHIIMGSNGFIVTAYPTTKHENYYGQRGYNLNNQKPGYYLSNRFKWNGRNTNNPSTYPLRHTT